MADQNDNTAAQNYVNSLKPEENVSGVTMLPNGEIVQVEEEKGFWEKAKEGAKEGIGGIINAVGGWITGQASDILPWGDVDAVDDDIFGKATLNGKNLQGDEGSIKTYLNNLKIVNDFEKNGLNNANDIASYNNARNVLSQYQFEDKDAEKKLKDLMYKENVIDFYGLGWDEKGNNTGNNTGYRIVRHGALKEEMQNASTQNFLNETKLKVAQKLVDQGYQANNNPGGRQSTVDEVMADLDSAISTIGSLGNRIQAYSDVINASQENDYQTANEYKRLTDGLIDMVGYILADNTGRSSGDIMREYISNVGNPMELDVKNFTNPNYTGAKNANLAKTLNLGHADAYEAALLLKEKYAIDKNFKEIGEGKDVISNSLGAVFNLIGLGGAAIGNVANGVFATAPALIQYGFVKSKYFIDNGFKDGHGYDMPTFASYFYGWSDSGMSSLKSRVQKGMGDVDGGELAQFINKYYSAADDIFSAVWGGKKLSFNFKSPNLGEAGISLAKKGSLVTKGSKIVSASNATKAVTKVEKGLSTEQQVNNLVDKSQGMRQFLTNVGNKVLDAGKGVANYFVVNPAKEMKAAWNEFKLLGGAGVNLQKVGYIGSSTLRWVGEEALQSAYFNGLTSQPYTEADMWADIMGSFISAFDRAGQFKTSFINMAQSSANTKWAVFGMQEFLKMNDSQIDKVLKKAQHNPNLLEEFGQTIADNVKPYIDKAQVVSAKTVRTAAQNLSNDVRNGLTKRIDDMILLGEQTFMRALAYSSDIRHNNAVRKIKNADGSESYKWAKGYDEKNVSDLKKKNISERKEKAYQEVFSPKPEAGIKRILTLKKIVKDNLALYCSHYFKDSVEKVNGKYRFKKGVTKDKQKLYFSYILSNLLRKEGLDRTDKLKRAIDHERKSIFGSGKLGEVEGGQMTEAGAFSMGGKFSNFSDRLQYFINSLVIDKQEKSEYLLAKLNELGAWIGRGFKWWLSKYKGINDPEKVELSELKKLIKEYGRNFDASIASEFKEEVYKTNAVDIKGSIANKTYADACKENKDLVSMDVDTFWRIVESDLEDIEKHELLKNYKKHDKIYKDKIIGIENSKPKYNDIDKNIFFNSAAEERATLGKGGRIYIPNNGYTKEGGNIIMDTSKDNADVLTYALENTFGKGTQGVYGVRKNRKLVGRIVTARKGFGDNKDARIMYFIPEKGSGVELKDFKFENRGFTYLIADSAQVKAEKKAKRKINIDPKDFIKEKKAELQVKKEEAIIEKEKQGDAPRLLNQGEWTAIMNSIKTKTNYRKFVDDTNQFVASVITKKIYNRVMSDKRLIDSDKFKVFSDLISLGHPVSDGFNLSKGFMPGVSDITRNIISDMMDESYLAEFKVQGLDVSIDGIVRKTNDGTMFNIYDATTLQPIGDVHLLGNTVEHMFIDGIEKEIEHMKLIDKLPTQKLDDAIKGKDTILPKVEQNEISFKKEIEKKTEEVVDARREVIDFSRAFFKELGFTNFEETLKNIYTNNLTKEEVVLRTVDNIQVDNSFRLRAINKFKRFLGESYSEPEVIGRKLKYELDMADTCLIYKQHHPKITLEDVELHKCMERYDEIKSDGFVLNASEKEIADMMLPNRKQYSQEELISVIGASLFEKPQQLNRVDMPKQLFVNRMNRLIQILTKDPESKNRPEDVKRNFINHAKEYVDLTNHSVAELVGDVNTHPENYIDMLQKIVDDNKTRQKKFDVKKDIKKKDTIASKLEEARQEYDKLKEEYNSLDSKKRQWIVDTKYYTRQANKFKFGIAMCDDVIEEVKKMVRNGLETKKYAGIPEEYLDELNKSLRQIDVMRKPDRDRLLNVIRGIFLNETYSKSVDILADTLDQRTRFVRLMQESKKVRTLYEQGTAKNILAQADEDDLTKVMLETLTGNGITNKAIFSKEQLTKNLKKLEGRLGKRQFIVMGDDGIKYTRNLRDSEINDIMDNFIRPKAQQILYGNIGGSTYIGGNSHALISIIYSETNQNIVGVGHEWFHSVIHGLCNADEIKRAEQLLDNTYKKYKGVIDAQASRKQQMQKYIDAIDEATTKEEKAKFKKEYERIATEEWLADRYGEYVAGKMELDDSDIIAFFKMIWQRIQALLTPEITEFFDDIYEGRLSNFTFNRDIYSRANIHNVGVRSEDDGVKQNTIHTLDKLISDDSANDYAMNPVYINSNTPTEKLEALLKQNDFHTILFALEGPGVGRLPSVMGVDGKSYMTEMKRAIKGFNTFESRALSRYAGIMDEGRIDNIAQVCMMQDSTSGKIQYSNSRSGKDYTVTVNVYNKRYHGSDGLSVKANITYSNGEAVNIVNYNRSKGDIKQQLNDALSLVNNKFNVYQRRNLAYSYTETNSYKRLTNSIADLVYRSVEKNVAVSSLPEYNMLDDTIKSAIEDCYKQTIYNYQIPHKDYAAYSREAYTDSIGNPLEDMVYNPLELQLSSSMFDKKGRKLLDLINKYQRVEGINIYKFMDGATPSVYFDIDINDAKVGFTFHTNNDVLKSVEYNSLDEYVGEPNNITWQEYPLLFTRNEINNISERFVGDSYYRKISTVSFLNTFMNALITNHPENVSLLGKSIVSQDGIDAITIYNKGTMPQGFDGNALLYYIPNSDDATIVQKQLTKSGKNVVYINTDWKASHIKEQADILQSKPESIVILTGGPKKVENNIIDDSYLTSKIDEFNMNVLNTKIGRDSLLSIDSLDKSIISDIHELDEIDLSIRKKFAELRQLEKKRRKQRQRYPETENRNDEINDEFENELRRQEERLNKQSEYLESLGLDYKKQDQESRELAQNKLRELQQMLGIYSQIDIPKARETSLQIGALEFYLNPTREPETKPLLRPDTETFDENEEFIKDVLSDNYYISRINDVLNGSTFEERYELAHELYESIPEVSRIKVNGMYDSIEELLENEEGIEKFLKAVKGILYKNKEVSHPAPKDIREKLQYRDESGYVEERINEEGVSVGRGEDQEYNVQRENDIDYVDSLYEDFNRRKNFDELSKDELNKIYDDILSKDKRVSDNAKLQLYASLQKKATEIAIDFMKDKLRTTVPVRDMIGEAQAELFGIIRRFSDATYQKQKIPNVLKKGIRDIDYFIDGDNAIWGGTRINGKSIEGITDRLKSVFDSYMDNSQGKNRETVAFIKYIESKMQEISDLIESQEGSMHPDYDLVARAFDEWKNEKYREQKSYKNSDDKAASNVEKQLRKVFPEEEYPEEITADDVRGLLGTRVKSMSSKIGDSENETEIGELIEDRGLYGSDLYELNEKSKEYLEQEEKLNKEIIAKYKKDINNLQKEKEEKIEEVVNKLNVSDSRGLILKSDSVQGYIDSLKQEDYYNIYLGSGKADPKWIAKKIYEQRYGKEGRQKFNRSKVSETIHGGRVEMIKNYGKDITDQWWLADLAQLGTDIGSAKNLVGDFDYWLGDLPLNMGISSEYGTMSYYDCVNRINSLKKSGETLSDETLARIQKYEDIAVDAVLGNLMNVESKIQDKNRFSIIWNHLGEDGTKKLLSEVNDAYSLYRLKQYITRRIANKGIREKLNKFFVEEWNKQDGFEYIEKGSDGIYFKDTLGFLGVQKPILFSDKADRNPLEVIHHRFSLSKQIDKYLNESIVLDIINPSKDKNGKRVLFVEKNGGIKNDLNSKNYIGKRCRKSEVELTKQKMRELGYEPIVIYWDRKFKLEGFNESTALEIPYDKYRFIVVPSERRTTNTKTIGGREIEFVSFNTAYANKENYSHQDVSNKWGIKKQEVTNTINNFLSKIEKPETRKSEQKIKSEEKSLGFHVDELRQEVKRINEQIRLTKETIEQFERNKWTRRKVYKDSIKDLDKLNKQLKEADRKFKAEQEAENKMLGVYFTKEQEMLINLQLNSYSKDWLNSINLRNEDKKEFNTVNLVPYDNCYYLVADITRKTPSGKEYKTTDIIGTIIDKKVYYENNGNLPRVSDRYAIRLNLNHKGNGKYSIWNSSEYQNAADESNIAKGYTYPILLVNDLDKANILRLGFSNYEFDVKLSTKGYKGFIRNIINNYEKEKRNLEKMRDEIRAENAKKLDEFVDTLDKYVGPTELPLSTQQQLLKQQIDYELKKYDNIDLSGIKLPDLSKPIDNVGSLSDHLFSILKPVFVGKTYLDAGEITKESNNYLNKYGNSLAILSGNSKARKDFSENRLKAQQQKTVKDSMFNKQKLAKEIADKGNEVKNLQKEYDDINTAIKNKLDQDIAFKNSNIYKDNLKAEELLKQAKKNIKNVKNKIQIDGQEGVTNKLIQVKPEYDYESVIMPLGKMIQGFNKNMFDAKIINTKKSQSVLLPEEKQLIKTYGDFNIYPYTFNDVDFITKINDLKDKGNFVLMTSDPYSLLCLKAKIENKFPDVEMVYERQEGNVAYFIKKKNDEFDKEELKEIVNEATSVGETMSNLSSYCTIK